MECIRGMVRTSSPLSAHPNCQAHLNDSFSPKEEDDFSDAVHLESMRDSFQQIDLLYRMVDLYSGHMEIVHQADDIMRIFRKGKCASLIGAEGLHQIGNSSSVLRIFHRLGVRYITLAHDKNNLYVDSAVSAQSTRVERLIDSTGGSRCHLQTSKVPAHNGLSPQGKEIVAEMNRIGMYVSNTLAHERLLLK